MAVTKHNWGYDYAFDGLRCVKTSVTSFASIDSTATSYARADANCNGCGASIPGITVNEIQNNMGKYNAINRAKRQCALDETWHEKYRPMAELCSLVEEATCQ